MQIFGIFNQQNADSVQNPRKKTIKTRRRQKPKKFNSNQLTMKTLFDFIFCDGKLTRDVVFYQVRVGTSEKDKNAQAFITSQASGSNFYWHLHSTESMTFIEKCAASLFNVDIPERLLRRKIVEVTWLARFLKKFPASLLNSQKIDTYGKSSAFFM